MQYNTFLEKIQRKFGDSSSSFNALVLDFLDDRLVSFESESLFRDLSERFTVSVSPSDYTFSLSAISTAYHSDALISLKPEANRSLQYMSLSRFQNDMKTDTEGIPQFYIPITLDAVQVYPIPQKAYVLTGYAIKQHPAVSLTADYIYYSNDKIKALRYGVIADIYEDRGDDRYLLYERKYAQQLEECRVKSRQRLQSRDITMELGN